MRTRKASKAAKEQSGLENLLESLHGETTENSNADLTAATGSTLANVSQQTVDQLLDRVGERQAAAKRRRAATSQGGTRQTRRKLAGECDDTLFQQRRSSGEGTLLRKHITTDAVVCGALARTTQDSGQLQQPTVQNSLAGQSASQELEETLPCEEDEFDWEDGDDAARVGIPIDRENSPAKGWNGEVSFHVDGIPADSSEKQRGKVSLKRASAKDKEFATLVHKSHLLCLLARGRAIDAACDDPLLQALSAFLSGFLCRHQRPSKASLVSVLPSRLMPSVDIEKLTPGRLEHLVSWVSWKCAAVEGLKGYSRELSARESFPMFHSTFRLLTPGEGSSHAIGLDGEPLQTRLPQVLQKQVGSPEEIAALSVSLFRGLGFTTRYVAVLDVASLKPDAESLEASANWEPEAADEEIGIRFQPQIDLESKKVATLTQILARCVPSALPNSLTTNSSSARVPANNVQTAGGRDQEGNQSRGRVWGEGGGQRDDRPKGKRAMKTSNNTANAKVRGGGKQVSKTSDADPRDSGAGRLAGGNEVELAMGPGKCTTSKRKGDEEFELQIAMALAATASAEVKSMDVSETSNVDKGKAMVGTGWTSWKQQKSAAGAAKLGKNSKGGTNAAVWSRKMGPVLQWAEVYCGGESDTGRWIHVDAARGIVDGADKVEGAAATCHLPLRYVVAFAGSGAKDLTRRYVTMWSTVTPLRVDASWWDSTLGPLRQLEALATAGSSVSSPLPLTFQTGSTECQPKAPNGWGGSEVGGLEISGHSTDIQLLTGLGSSGKLTPVKELKLEQLNQRNSSGSSPHNNTRSALEDMEMDTKMFTEPLPTNQQAYKSHHLYVIERWLTKYQTLYPKGPVLGYCAGQAVYPRSSVQTLHTADRWLRDGRKVKLGESPAKVVKASHLSSKESHSDVAKLNLEEGSTPGSSTTLFGKWQTEAWQPPRAVGGIVPRNERGQVDVWSEKCIPPGTVHLRFPRLVPLAQLLGIDFAPAMVGFEIRKGRSFPVYDGIVVCEEFEGLIMDAYAEAEDQRNAEVLRKREDQAAGRWSQLLRSVATRQRLRATYEAESASLLASPRLQTGTSVEENNDKTDSCPAGSTTTPSPSGIMDAKKFLHGEKAGGIGRVGNDVEQKKGGPDALHTHHFSEENQSYDEETGVRTKWCLCGFKLQVEEM